MKHHWLLGLVFGYVACSAGICYWAGCRLRRERERMELRERMIRLCGPC
jgi:hypothetical protein